MRATITTKLINKLTKELKINIEQHITNDIEQIASGLNKSGSKKLLNDKNKLVNAILEQMHNIPKKEINKELLSKIVYNTLQVV